MIIPNSKINLVSEQIDGSARFYRDRLAAHDSAFRRVVLNKKHNDGACCFQIVDDGEK